MFLLTHIIITLLLLGLTIPFHGLGDESAKLNPHTRKLTAQVQFYKRQLNSSRRELKVYKKKTKSMNRQIQLCHVMLRHCN